MGDSGEPSEIVEIVIRLGNMTKDCFDAYDHIEQQKHAREILANSVKQRKERTSLVKISVAQRAALNRIRGKLCKWNDDRKLMTDHEYASGDEIIRVAKKTR